MVLGMIGLYWTGMATQSQEVAQDSVPRGRRLHRRAGGLVRARRRAVRRRGRGMDVVPIAQQGQDGGARDRGRHRVGHFGDDLRGGEIRGRVRQGVHELLAGDGIELRSERGHAAGSRGAVAPGHARVHQPSASSASVPTASAPTPPTISPSGTVGGAYNANPKTLWGRALHNTYYQILSEFGTVGAGLFFWLVWDFFQRNRKLRQPQRIQAWIARHRRAAQPPEPVVRARRRPCWRSC